VLDTTYFFAASIVRAKGSIQSGLVPVVGGRHAAFIFSTSPANVTLMEYRRGRIP
jgi:hypothetical protein